MTDSISTAKIPSLVFTPENQRAAASVLHQMINDAVAPFKGKIIDPQLIRDMGKAITDATVEWNKRYPILNRHNIGFELVNNEGRITIIPSPDFQKLLAGMII